MRARTTRPKTAEDRAIEAEERRKIQEYQARFTCAGRCHASGRETPRHGAKGGGTPHPEAT